MNKLTEEEQYKTGGTNGFFLNVSLHPRLKL